MARGNIIARNSGIRLIMYWLLVVRRQCLRMLRSWQGWILIRITALYEQIRTSRRCRQKKLGSHNPHDSCEIPTWICLNSRNESIAEQINSEFAELVGENLTDCYELWARALRKVGEKVLGIQMPCHSGSWIMREELGALARELRRMLLWMGARPHSCATELCARLTKRRCVTFLTSGGWQRRRQYKRQLTVTNLITSLRVQGAAYRFWTWEARPLPYT